MNTHHKNFIDLICEISPDIKIAEQSMAEEWLPESPPITTLFSAIGYEITERFDAADTQTNEALFALIEKGMNSDDSMLATAVATGLIEAAVTRAT